MQWFGSSFHVASTLKMSKVTAGWLGCS